MTYPTYGCAGGASVGTVVNFPGSGILYPSGITAGPDGNLWFTNSSFFTNPGNDSIGRITPSGVVTKYTGTGIFSPQGIAAGRL